MQQTDLLQKVLVFRETHKPFMSKILSSNHRFVRQFLYILLTHRHTENQTLTKT